MTYKRARKRSREQIKCEMLRACLTPNTPTNIMYAAGISYRPLKAFLNDLLDKGLIGLVEEKPRRGHRDGRIAGVYLTTDEGRRVLRQFEDLMEVLV